MCRKVAVAKLTDDRELEVDGEQTCSSYSINVADPVINATVGSPGAQVSWLALAASRSRLARLAAVLSLPVLAYAIDDRWLYTDPLSIDPWLYFGIAANFELHRAHFADTYYWTRFAWTLPGAALHGLFDPLVAKHLWHFAFFYLALLSLYGTLSRLGDARTALVGAVVLSLDRMFLVAIGWDYMDGAAATYILLALYLLTVGSMGSARWASALFLAAGFAFGLAVNAYLPLVAFLPCLWAYGAVILQRRKVPGLGRLTLLLPTGLGLSVLLAMAINWHFTGRFNYLEPNVRIIRKIVETGAFAPRPLYERIFSYLPSPWATWLYLPLILAALMAVAVAVGAMRKRPLSLFEAAAFTLYGTTLLVVVLFEVANRSVIMGFNYFSAVYPSMYLAMAALIGGSLNRSGRVGATLLGGALFVGAAAIHGWSLDAPTVLCVGLCWYVDFPEAALDSPTAAIVAGCLGASLAWIVIRRFADREHSWLHGLAAALLVGIILGGLFLRAEFASRVLARTDRETFLTILDGVAAVKTYAPKERPFFYYNADGPFGYVGNAINGAHLWGYTMLGNKLPEIDCLEVATMPRTGRIVLMGPDEAEMSAGTAALATCGRTFRQVGHHRIDRQALTYHMAFYALADGP